MRTIKFRALDMKGEQWIYGYYHEDTLDAWMYTEVGYIQVQKKTVGQFTCLLDKNGVEIYEGDILGCWVKDLDGNPMMSFKHHVKDIREAPADGNCWWTEKGEVLGNVWQNPELLKS